MVDGTVSYLNRSILPVYSNLNVFEDVVRYHVIITAIKIANYVKVQCLGNDLILALDYKVNFPSRKLLAVYKLVINVQLHFSLC